VAEINIGNRPKVQEKELLPCATPCPTVLDMLSNRSFASITKALKDGWDIKTSDPFNNNLLSP